MNRERLMLLVDALETRIPAAKFDLETYRGLSRLPYQPNEHLISNEDLLNTCGTSGCAVGWACALPEFNAQGLVWNQAEGLPELVGFKAPPGPYADVNQRDEQRWAAWLGICEFFDIDDDTAESLFIEESYCGVVPENEKAAPGDVARRIRTLLQDQPA